jgi:hypothetical protein
VEGPRVFTGPSLRPGKKPNQPVILIAYIGERADLKSMPRLKKSSALKFYGLSLPGCGGRIAGACHVNADVAHLANVAHGANGR